MPRYILEYILRIESGSQNAIQENKSHVDETNDFLWVMCFIVTLACTTIYFIYHILCRIYQSAIQIEMYWSLLCQKGQN